MRIDDRILHSIVYLYPSKEAAQKGSKLGGTGFVIGYPFNEDIVRYGFPLDDRGDSGPDFLYVVTNRHIAITDGCRTIAINDVHGEKVILQTSKDDWVYFETGDDLAICPIALSTSLHKYVDIPVRMLLTEEVIANFDIGVGEWVYIVGRFSELQGKGKVLPVARFGNIALMPHEPMMLEGEPQTAFLLEMRSIGGYSGSPAFVEIFDPNKRPKSFVLNRSFKERPVRYGPWLLGVDFGHLPLKQPINEGKKKTGFHVVGNSAMTGVIAAWRLADLLKDRGLVDMREIEREKRREREERQQSMIPDDDSFIADRLESSDLSPDLRESIRRKIESGEDEGVDRDAFFKLLGRTSEAERPDPED